MQLIDVGDDVVVAVVAIVAILIISFRINVGSSFCHYVEEVINFVFQISCSTSGLVVLFLNKLLGSRTWSLAKIVNGCLTGNINMIANQHNL